MKIAILGTTYPFRGGLASYNERLAREFQNEGHSVTIFTFTTQYPSFLFPGQTQFSEEEAPKDLDIRRTLSSVNPYTWLTTGYDIKDGDFDLLIIKFWLPFMGPAFGTVARIAKKNKKTRVICILDNIIPHEARVGDIALTKYFVKPIDGFVAMSQNVYDDLSKFEKNKPRVLTPHPLFDNFGAPISRNDALEHLKLDSKHRYVLFFGFIRKYKGLDLLIEAFSKRDFAAEGIKLLIVGEFYEDKQPYLDLIQNYKLQDQVILVDKFITDSEVKYYFCASDILVQPYRNATQSGVSQIAYHFDLPMIVTNVGGLPDLCPPDIGYVVPVDAEVIAQAIDTFYKENKHDEFVENIKIEKKKYSWNILATKIIELKSTIDQEYAGTKKVHQ